jgi:UDP-N-acetylglucosamine 2-epimerase (non-hydrolysing)
MKKLKVMTIVGTRPEIIRLSNIIKLFDAHFDHVLVHTGQNYDPNLNDIFFKDFGLRAPDHYLNTPGKNLGETVGNVISRSYDVLVKEAPDAVLILGDTNSSLAAYSAKRLKIPIFHMEAGNRCFDQNVPEELNRKVVDHLSDINLPYTEHSRRYLISEGMSKDTVFVTGSPMYEVIQSNLDSIASSKILSKLGLKDKDYFLVSMHREENLDIGYKLDSLVASLNAVAEKYGKPVIFSTHPRTLKKKEEKGLKFHPLIRNLEPFGFFDYCHLQKHARCVLSDSGTIPEESTMLNFPAISIRTSMERPEALEEGTIILAGIDPDEVLASIEMAISTHDEGRKVMLKEYQIPNVSERVLKVIQSYTPVINQRVWQKNMVEKR